MLVPALLSILAAPPNVVFIAVDDLRPELGCYGYEHADSPSIDLLAERSVRFSRHYVQVPTCGASRFALLTGRSPAATGLDGGNHGFLKGPTALSQQPMEAAQTFPELLRQNGYHSVCIGKISHTVDNKDYAYNGSGNGKPEVPFAWDQVLTPFGSWQRGWGAFFAYPDGVHREDGSGHRPLMDFTVEKDEDLPDGLIAAEAIASIRRLAPSDQPFLLAVGFYKPHLPWVAPRSDWEATKRNGDEPLVGDSAYTHRSGEFYKYQMPFEKPLGREAAAVARRAYGACVRYTDRQIGRVLDAIDASGEAENTVVVLWGDHGWCLGDWSVWGKHTPLEEANHSPLLVAAPGTAPGVCEVPTETLDIYPTLVELCQLSQRATAHPLDGTSLLQRLHDPSGSVDQETADVAISYWNGAVSVRSSTHRAIGRWKKGAWRDIELYEPESETPARNLVGDQMALARSLLDAAPRPSSK